MAKATMKSPIRKEKFQSFFQSLFFKVRNNIIEKRIKKVKFTAPPERWGDVQRLNAMSDEKIVDKKTVKRTAKIIRIIFFWLLYRSANCQKNLELDIICQKNKNKIEENIILKTMALPHSGGKNNGEAANKGNARIEKNPSKKTRYDLFMALLISI